MEIINTLASIYNNAITYLFNQNIEFYQILIALFILDFLIFELCYMVKGMRR